MDYGGALDRISLSVHRCFRKVFKKWGEIVYTYPVIVITISLLFFLVMIYGTTLYEVDSDIKTLWSPPNSRVWKDYSSIAEVFETKIVSIDMYLVGKPMGENVLSLEVLKLIKQFEEEFMDQVTVDGMNFNDICYKAGNRRQCEKKNNPLSFFVKWDESYDFSEVNDSYELLEKMRSGRGTPELFPEGTSDFINIVPIFGGTKPSTIETYANGTNNIESAKAIHWTYFAVRNETVEGILKEFNKNLETFASRFSENNEYVEIYILTETLLFEPIEDATEIDYKIILSGCVVFLYSFIVLGKLDTYNSRLLCTVAGITSVGIAFAECIAMGSYLSIKGNVSIGALPFVMLGIGVDDMFILLTGLENAPNSKPAKQKFVYMMKHAGLSITITSITTILSFFCGSLTSVQAMKHFCLYGSFGMFFDYLNQMSFFSAVVALDLRRKEKKIGDCFGLVFCEPNSKACCYGKYSFDSQGVPREPITRVLLRDYFTPLILKPTSRVLIIVFFSGVFIFNIYEVANIEFNFVIETGLRGDYKVFQATSIKNTYFGNVDYWDIGFYSISSEFETLENQVNLLNLADDIANCRKCRGN